MADFNIFLDISQIGSRAAVADLNGIEVQPHDGTFTSITTGSDDAASIGVASRHNDRRPRRRRSISLDCPSGGNPLVGDDVRILVVERSHECSMLDHVRQLFSSLRSKTCRTWRRIPSIIKAFVLIFTTLTIAYCIKDYAISFGLDNIAAKMEVFVPPMNIELETELRANTGIDPIGWFSDNTHTNITTLSAQQLESIKATRPRAALISLVRNAELEGMLDSVSQLEARFNGRETHKYDWVFYNNEEFSEEFKQAIANATTSQCFFETIPKEHWSLPDWLDLKRFDSARIFLGSIAVGKAHMESYHHMCRWNAGFFALEERLQNYDWFWRVEPGVQYTCDVNYDVFRFMQDNNMAYGFNMAILDDARSFPSLWPRTEEFLKYNRDMVHPNANMKWLLHEAQGDDGHIRAPGFQGTLGGDYNNCQFYSNFEIGSLKFFRGKEHQDYFNDLDRAGGFFYERYSDAPVHTLSVSMFLPKSQVWYFRDIGYKHGLCEQCPPHVETPLTTGTALTDGSEVLETLHLVNAQDAEKQQFSDSSDDFDSLSSPEELETPVSNDWKGIQRRYQEHLDKMLKDFKRRDEIRESFERRRGMPGLMCGCTTNNFDINHSKLVPYESKQRKPMDTCIRQWLGGKWLTAEYGYMEGDTSIRNYVLTGMESNPYLEVPDVDKNLRTPVRS